MGARVEAVAEGEEGGSGKVGGVKVERTLGAFGCLRWCVGPLLSHVRRELTPQVRTSWTAGLGRTKSINWR